jgi:hypothetical protein
MGEPTTHTPFESQAAGRTRELVAVLHVPGAQVVPGAYLRQAPLPLHAPSVPHELLPMSLQAPRGSGAPGRVRVQVPGDAPSAQDRHGPWQESPQQTLSTQKVLAHSVPDWQGWPGPFLPQLCAASMQRIPGAQSEFWLQVALQVPVAAEQA